MVFVAVSYMLPSVIFTIYRVLHQVFEDVIVSYGESYF